MLRPPPSPTPFPYTTLFRSDRRAVRRAVLDRRQPRHRRGDLHVDVRTVDLLRDPARLLERALRVVGKPGQYLHRDVAVDPVRGDRKSTRLNSSHDQISYAAF